MSEHEVEEVREEEEEAETHHNGVVTGIPGRRASVNGVLDLRGVATEQVAGIRSLNVNGVVLLDEENRNGLADVESNVNGTVVVADPSLRLMIEADMVFSKAAVEAMPAGQQIMLVGNIFFKPDVPPGLVAEKFERLVVVGIMVACEGVYGALMGRMERTGVTVQLPQDVGEVVRTTGTSEWTPEYLTRLPDGTTYVNVGVTSIPAEVTEELVAAKIAAYHNVGVTKGPKEIIALLKARCETSQGVFSSEEEEGED